jgi:hypothetical protein
VPTRSGEAECQGPGAGAHSAGRRPAARIERRGTECMVTVTNGELGKAYQAHRLRNGMPLLGPR